MIVLPIRVQDRLNDRVGTIVAQNTVATGTDPASGSILYALTAVVVWDDGEGPAIDMVDPSTLKALEVVGIEDDTQDDGEENGDFE